MNGRGNSSQKPPHFEDIFSIPQGQPEILRPLAPEVNALLQLYSKQDCEPSSRALSRTLKSGNVIWNHFARAVVQLDDHIAVKLGPDISLTDAYMTAHIQKHSADILVPQPLGTLSVGGITYAFMTLIEGSSLDKL